ncbi:NADH oxidase [Desulfosarcina ovata subsp. sediminis]|uniref:NADH oxidase n=1 Tax=Desulfosarcina ovata subsp. sediminis TaxID=885957 RepID=A0A5K8A1L3_9BACT|nr:FAD-dependent oxidoreductase [Desulfosarcina ovata]BBO86258.1 NADH oxidase [Desulfosarcina ovata subsp. sediminis]
MKLFEPIEIGGMPVKNRIVMAPMTSHYARKGIVTERMVHFYTARAKGGVGLITIEDGIVDYPLGNNTDNPLAVDHDRCIPGLTKLSKAIKKEGARAMLQLSHAGRRAGHLSPRTMRLDRTGGRLPVAPSPLAHPSPGHVVPRPLSTGEIDDIIEAFGQAARRAVEAGFDMIGLHCAHMYLLGQFLSPWANKRKDAYGGNLEGRLKIVLKIIRRIRSEVGTGYPIVCRINGQEPEEGNTVDELCFIAKALESNGVAALHVSVGFGSILWDKDFIPAEATMGMPEGCIVHLAENIKQAVSIPVITVNKIRHVDFAERVLQEDRADMIALGRALLADPQWPNKARQGRWDDIRPCVSCCQGCVGNIEKGQPISCLVNPMLGREKTARIRPVGAKRAKRVLVLGGGPAGLEASIVASQRGHQVELWERHADLGGRLRIAATPPGKTELDEFKAFLHRQAANQGVRIVLNRAADVDAVLEEHPDVVVVATGARPHIPEFAVTGNGFVKTVAEILNTGVPEGDSAVIVGGGLVGLETAHYLLEMRKRVTVVEMGEALGQDMPMITRMPLLLQLGAKGARMLAEARAREIRTNGVRVDIKGEETWLHADFVVLCTGDVADQELETALGSHGIPVHAIGDCRQPGDMPAAVYQGFMAGLEI